MLFPVHHIRNHPARPFLALLRSCQRPYSAHWRARLPLLRGSTQLVAGSVETRRWNSSVGKVDNGIANDKLESKSGSASVSQPQANSQLQPDVAQTEQQMKESSSPKTEEVQTTPSATQADKTFSEADSHARPAPYSKDQLEDFFNYTAGTWLFNAEEQKRLRYLHFNVDALLEEAVKSTGSSYCTHLHKLDDGIYNRTFEITFNTGQVVLAKFPYPMAGPKHYTVASEVATMHFARTRLYLPVPKVYAWSSHAESSSVGAEYIVMEKMKGIPLNKRWNIAGGSWNCTEKDLEKVVAEFVLAQQIMTNAIFPGMGSMYFANDVPRDSRIPLQLEYREEAEEVEKETQKQKQNQDEPPVEYVLGPSVERRFWRDGRAELNIFRGPWPDFLSYMLSVVDCEIEWLRTKAKPHSPDSPRYISEEDNSPDKHIELLKKYRQTLPYFIPASDDFNRFVLHHPHLTSQILVPESGDMEILAYPDWQNSFVNVLMNLYETPGFVEYQGGEYIKQPPLDPKAPFPELPKNFEELTEQQQFVAQVEHIQAVRYKLYHDLTAENNPALHSCRNRPEPEFCLVPLQWCSKTWEEGLAPFKILLLKIADSWEDIAPGKPCPFSFTKEERKASEERMARWLVRSSLELIPERFGFIADALIENQSLEEAKKWNNGLLEAVLEKAPEGEKENFKKAWPIQDGALSLTAQTCH